MEGRSSAGHPPHALVTFDFGEKLVVFNQKDNLNVTQVRCELVWILKATHVVFCMYGWT